MRELIIPIHNPDYTVAYILLILSIVVGIITYKLWKRGNDETKTQRNAPRNLPGI